MVGHATWAGVRPAGIQPKLSCMACKPANRTSLNLFTGKITLFTDTFHGCFFYAYLCSGILRTSYGYRLFRSGSGITCIFWKSKSKMAEKQILELDSVDKYNVLFGLETLHPLVSVVDLRKAEKQPGSMQMNYGLYALYLKCTKSCAIRYGRRNYDYQEGTVVSFAPGQVVHVDMIDEEPHPEVYGLLFHPDFIHGTSLGKNIRRYSFFSYSSNEALHLSEQEKGLFLDCLRRIGIELEHGSDRHSKALISMNIELLLNYCLRFYERQFITRNVPENDELSRFEQLLDEYFQSGKAEKDGLPSVRYFADKICLSPNYFGDMIKKETGKSPQEHIQGKVIDLAKEQIIGTELTISQIAYSLGFQYPQHLCRMFKKKEGCTPNEYRMQSQKA